MKNKRKEEIEVSRLFEFRIPELCNQEADGGGIKIIINIGGNSSSYKGHRFSPSDDR